MLNKCRYGCNKLANHFLILIIIPFTLVVPTNFIKFDLHAATGDTQVIIIERKIIDTSIFGNAPPFDESGNHIRNSTDYYPQQVCIPVNNKVSWINTDKIPHTVTQEKNNLSQTEPFDSGLIKPLSNYTRVFDSLGNYSYVDEKEPNLDGLIIVLPTEQDCDIFLKNQLIEGNRIAAEGSERREQTGVFK